MAAAGLMHEWYRFLDARSDDEAVCELMRHSARLELVYDELVKASRGLTYAPGGDVDDALTAAILQRPDLRLAAARLQQARLIADFERLRRIPDPLVNAGYKRTMGQDTGVAGVTMTIPLFDHNGQARARAEAVARAASFDEAALRARALADARASMSAATALALRASRVRTELLQPAEGVRNAAQAMFREGAADVLKLVDAERVYMDVQREALSLAVDAYVAAVEARFATAQEEIP